MCIFVYVWVSDAMMHMWRWEGSLQESVLPAMTTEPLESPRFSFLDVSLFCSDNILLYSPGWPRICSVPQVGLEFSRLLSLLIPGITGTYYHNSAYAAFLIFLELKLQEMISPKNLPLLRKYATLI